jgi:hypothetical protein
MQSSFDRTALVLLGIFSLFIVSPVSAEWNIEVLDQPYSFENVSNQSNTVQIIELTDGSGTPINESQLVGDSIVEYDYNGTTEGMEWLNNGYWYAEFALNETGGEVEFEAQGETESSLIGDSTDGTNETRVFNLTNMSVNLMNDFSEPLNPEQSFDIQVNVTDTFNDQFEDQADVDIYFTNATWTSEIYNINNLDDLNRDGQNDHYKNFGLDLDLDYFSSYVMHVNATNTSDVGYENPSGVLSMYIETLPEIIGNIQRLNASSGCDGQSFFGECERDAVIDTAFNITSSDAENVNLTLSLRNKSSGMWENQSTVVMTDSGDGEFFTGEITVPDINTSAYDRVFQLQYNATNGGREEIIERVVDYNDFRIVDKSDSVTAKGSYNVKLEIRKYFTPELLNNSRINDSMITIEQPSGELLTNFSVDQMERLESSGHFQKNIDVPVDAEIGLYQMNVQVTNIYGHAKSESFNFDVTDIQQTFNLNTDEFQETVNKTGEHSFNLTFGNRINSETNISTEISGDIENFTSINNGENISLGPEENRNVSLLFDVDFVDEYSGEIKFMDADANYNTTLDIDLSRNACSYRNGSICVLGSGLNTSSDETGDITKEFVVINFGEKNESYTFSFDLSGNITEQASLGNNQSTLNTENDTESVNMTYSVTKPGFYSGIVELNNEQDTLEIPVSLNSTVEPTDLSIAISEEIDLGEIQEGESTSADIEVENTGNVDVSNLEVSSEDYSISADSMSLSAGSTETVSVEFSDITSESGQITVTAGSDSDSTTETVSVSATVVPDYEEKANELENRIIDLDSRVSSDSEYQTELNNVQSSVSDLRSAYRQGDYERAQTVNTQIENTLDTLGRDIAASSEPEPSNPQPQPGQDSDGGGMPIVPIAGVIFVVLIASFIGYTSIEFEKGDPLYNVLGK